MSFLHIGLLAGAAFALIPVLIHISGRKQPKLITFPALQFVRATQIKSARGWTLKRFLLLLLRVLMIALLALALASPRVHQASFASWLSIGLIGILGLFASVVCAFAWVGRAANAVKYTTLAIATLLLSVAGAWSSWVLARGPATPMQSSSGPVAAAIIVDTSPTMDYRFQNVTRLEKAQEFANWIVGRLNAQSMIGVLTGNAGDRLQIGHAAAEQKIERLKVQGSTVDLLDRIRRAVELVRESDLDRHEVYVVTDMSANPWLKNDSQVAAVLGQGSPVLLQIVDVGSSEHFNWAIDQVRVSQDVAQVGATIQVDAVVKSARQTAAQQVVLELLSEPNEAGYPRIENGKLVTPPTKVLDRRLADSNGMGDMVDFSFQISDLPLGTNKYQLRLSSVDPLMLDATYSFTVEGVKSGAILIVDGTAGRDKNRRQADEASLLSLMLDPNSTSSTVIDLSQLEQSKLAEYAYVAIWNPPMQLPGTTAKMLNDYVDQGGGLVLVLGDSIEPRKLNVPADQKTLENLLPGRVARLTRRPQGDAILENVDLTHGIWQEFGKEVQSIPWARFPVNRHWDIEDLKPSAKPLARFAISGLPAIMEEIRGEGRIITFATPIPDLERAGYAPWNDLTISPDAWVSFGTMLGTGRYLQATVN